MVLVGLIEKPPEVVRRWPRQTFVAVRGGCGAPHTEATRIPITAIIIAGHCHSPLKALPAPLAAAFDALLGTVSSNIRWHLLVAPRCHVPASLCRVNHDCLIAGGALGGDDVRLLKRALEEVTMSILSCALCTVLGQCTRATLVSLATNLGLISLTLPPP
jgi:hypothetical protein